MAKLQSTPRQIADRIVDDYLSGTGQSSAGSDYLITLVTEAITAERTQQDAAALKYAHKLDSAEAGALAMYQRGEVAGWRGAIALVTGIEMGTRRHDAAEADTIKRALEILKEQAPQ